LRYQEESWIYSERKISSKLSGKNSILCKIDNKVEASVQSTYHHPRVNVDIFRPVSETAKSSSKTLRHPSFNRKARTYCAKIGSASSLLLTAEFYNEIYSSGEKKNRMLFYVWNTTGI
jgi:hypothetical protein